MPAQGTRSCSVPAPATHGLQGYSLLQGAVEHTVGTAESHTCKEGKQTEATQDPGHFGTNGTWGTLSACLVKCYHPPDLGISLIIGPDTQALADHV
eukprot:3968517-Amphidinium_carterae.3